MKYLLTLIFTIVFHGAFALQGSIVDSLKLLTNPDQPDTVIITAYNRLTLQYSLTNKDSSLYFARKALAKGQDVGHKLLTSGAMFVMAGTYADHDQIDSALYWWKESLILRTEINHTSAMSSCCLNIGWCFDYLSEYDSAIRYYLKAVELGESISSDQNLAFAYNNIGRIFRAQGDYGKALDYYARSLALKRKNNNTRGVITTLGNMAHIYLVNKSYDSAVMIMSESLDLSQGIADTALIGWAYSGLAEGFKKQGQIDEALTAHLNAEKFLNVKGTKTDQLTNHAGLALVYMDLKDFTSAKEHFDHSLKLAKQVANPAKILEIYKGMSQMYERTGDFEEALIYYRSYDSLSTYIFNENRTATIEELEQKFETEKKESQIARLEATQQRSIYQRNLFIVGLFAAVATGVFLFLLLRAKNKSNVRIAKALSEKEVLLKEIHHRVKNNLQIVSSLLSLQSRYIEDSTALEAVNEGQNRVKSMALIHQKLYQDDNLTGVTAFDYIQNLTQGLQTSFGMDSGRIHVNYEVDDLMIDVDTLIPIGLILNELISNSFKHAFRENSEGEINIQLTKKQEELKLCVSDNGGGYEHPNEENSFGMRLIRSLALKLDALVDFKSGSGAETTLTIRKFKLISA